MTRFNSSDIAARAMQGLIGATALVLSMTATAGAAETSKVGDALASGTLYSANESGLNCFFTNFGSTNLTVTEQEIFQTGSTTAIVANSTCTTGSTVAPDQTCIIYTQSALSTIEGYSCKVAFSGTAANVRGTLQLFDSSGNSLVATELH